MERIQVHILVTGLVERVDRATDTDSLRAAAQALGLPDLVGVPDAGDNLRLDLDMGVLRLLIDGLLGAVFHGFDQTFVQFGRFSHQVSRSVDSLVISGLVTGVSGLGDGLPVEDVLLVTLVNEDQFLELFDYNVPSKLRLRSGHQSC